MTSAAPTSQRAADPASLFPPRPGRRKMRARPTRAAAGVALVPSASMLTPAAAGSLGAGASLEAAVAGTPGAVAGAGSASESPGAATPSSSWVDPLIEVAQRTDRRHGDRLVRVYVEVSVLVVQLLWFVGALRA